MPFPKTSPGMVTLETNSVTLTLPPQAPVMENEREEDLGE